MSLICLGSFFASSIFTKIFAYGNFYAVNMNLMFFCMKKFAKLDFLIFHGNFEVLRKVEKLRSFHEKLKNQAFTNFFMQKITLNSYSPHKNKQRKNFHENWMSKKE